MSSERRFKGLMSEQYQLLRLALPHFDELQRLVGEAVAGHVPQERGDRVRVLEIGCGSGITTNSILSARKDAVVVAVDNEEKMIGQASANLAEFIQEGRCRLVQQDALSYLQGHPEGVFDIVASALTLHNLNRDYRRPLHKEIHRVLKPGGLFVNADKYAEEDDQRFQALQLAMARFFDAFVPLGKLDLLREWVLHNLADHAPERVMRERETVQELTALGFRDITVRCRHNMEALLVAGKP